MKPGTTKTLLFGVVLAIIAVNAVLFLKTQQGPSTPRTPTTTNSYPALLQAADKLQDAPALDGNEENSLELLSQFVEQNTPALLGARAALDAECWVPLGTNVDRSGDFGRLKKLGRAMQSEARLAVLEGRMGDAADVGLQIVQLGHQSARGGALIDSLVGLALEQLGLTAIPPPAKLDAKTAARVASELARMEERRPPAKQVWEQEAAWVRRVHGWKGQAARLLTQSSLEKSRKAWLSQYEKAQLQARMAAVEFAARAHELENGKPPASWGDLVPAYLPSVPLTPPTEDGKDAPVPYQFHR